MHQIRVPRTRDWQIAARLASALCMAFGIKIIKPMKVANICSRNGVANFLRSAMVSAQSRDFGMFDTPSSSLTLVRDEEHQSRRQFSRLGAASRQQNQVQSQPIGTGKFSVGLSYTSPSLFYFGSQRQSE